MSSELYCERYTDKSFVVRGSKTKEYKEQLKACKCKFNSSLTDKQTGEKFAGWLYFENNKDEVENFVQSITNEQPIFTPIISKVKLTSNSSNLESQIGEIKDLISLMENSIRDLRRKFNLLQEQVQERQSEELPKPSRRTEIVFVEDDDDQESISRLLPLPSELRRQ
jgi:hypothetical protein